MRVLEDDLHQVLTKAILIVDDDPLSLKLLRAEIEGAQYHVLSAANGVEALELLKKEPVALIISDILMPKMDGYRLCFELRKNEAWNAIPFIFYSSTYTSAADEKLARDLRGSAFLRKPASMDVILNTIHDVLYNPIIQRGQNSEHVMLGLEVLEEYSEHLVTKLEEKNRELVLSAEQLRTSEEKYRNIFDLTNDFAYKGRVESDGSILLEWVTGGIMRITEYTPDEAYARDFWRLIVAPEDMPVVIRHIEQILSGRQETAEFRIRSKSGEIRWLRNVIRPIGNEGHTQVTTFYGAAEDITERKHAEMALVESEARFHSLFTNISEAFVLSEILYDEAGNPYDFRLLEVNQVYEKQIGLSGDQVMGKLARELFPDSDPSLLGIYARVAETGQPVRFEKYNAVSGRYYEQFVYDMGQDRVAILATDITDRKTNEQLLRDVQRREAIGVLSGGIAHDFNNLVGVMMGYVSLAKKQLSDHHPAGKQLGQAMLAMERAAELTNQILAYSGKGKVQISTLDVCDEIRRNVSLFTVSMPKNVKLVTQLPSTPVYVSGDTAQIKQVIMNLIINGGDAIGDKQGVVSITLSIVSMTNDTLLPYTMITNTPLKEGDYALLEVSDNGIGMSPETMNKIFDPFFTTKFTGRGLGLSALLGIIRAHEGGIAIESIEGVGTIFRIILPLAAAPETRGPLQPEIKAPLHHVTTTVLVIDDEEAIAGMAREILESAQYSVLTELNPAVAVKLYELHRSEIQVVLLDLTMPEMSGAQVAEAIHAINPEVKIIISSGYSEQEIKNKIDMSKVSGIIQKPYNVQSLLNLVQSVMQ
jgi:two-component system, cell cycle sensor histidine kinase and response regulator CckA